MAQESHSQVSHNRRFATAVFGERQAVRQKVLLLLDCMSPFTNEATRPRYCDEGYPDGLGRASNKEGESWVIILRPLSESIRQNRVMQ
jgi:hypothetical protein